ncbi:MAG: MBL fold metallo-hydrolase [Verrucomicrobiota bacterium]|nr:MBL fold metallo-hydrolase [Verrucomicrobiota bacterium]
MMIPLEDGAADILGKAQRGLGISDSELAEDSGVRPEQVRQLRDGKINTEVAERVAPRLGLHAPSLLRLAEGTWEPAQLAQIDGVAQFNTQYGDMTVNAYLLWDSRTREAIAFDTGADCAEMLRRAREEKLAIKLILLTHAHSDHVADLPRLQAETGAPTFISEHESATGAERIKEGKQFQLGRLRVETRLTSGHSAGGITYVVNGLVRTVAVVGDSLFAGSMGGGAVSYQDALRNNLEKILTLPEDTIVCPGHGPLTTVGKEKRDNPFFAATFQR